MPDAAPMKTCFVIIGYGRKADPATGRSLDLDKTFEQLIQPACDRVGLNAFRAIDANLTGSIDRLMHEWICLADFVIADLTTLNANVFYELGVRHALRPSTTLILADRKLMDRIPFDLSSFIVHAYDHPDDRPPDSSGAEPAFEPEGIARLTELLQRVLREGERGQPESDSPVYDFLRGLGEPVRPKALDDTRAPIYVGPDERRDKRKAEDSLADVIGMAKEHRQNHDYVEAIRLYRKAIDLFRSEKPYPGMKVDVFLYQSLAVVTYLHGGAAGPGGVVDRQQAIQALRDAERILKDYCALDITADAETLSIAGDIYHRLFKLSCRSEYLRPWLLYHWKCYRDFAQKFYFPFEVRQCFESAIDCYQRAWTSKDLSHYAERTAQVFTDVARSTWNLHMKLRYYSEASTARRRAQRKGPQPGLFRTMATSAILLLLLLLGIGVGAGFVGGNASGRARSVDARPPQSVPPGPQPVPTTGDEVRPGDSDVLRQLRSLSATVTEIRTTVGTRRPDGPTLVTATGDIDQRATTILHVLQGIDPHLVEVLAVLGRLRPPDLESVLAALNRVDRTTSRTAAVVGDSASPGGAGADSILDLVRQIDGATKATAGTVGDIRRRENPEPASGMNDIASTATTILRELRKSRTMPEPATLSRTGPAMQFGTLPSVVKGFAYDLNGPSARAPELGLTIDTRSTGQCPGTNTARAAADGERVCVRIASPSGRLLLEDSLLTVATRARRDEWGESDTKRAVQFNDGSQGFWYAIVVNRDGRGRYAVVRRCNERCAP